MTKEEVFNQLQAVFQEIFDDETLTIEADTTASDIDEWDSLTHVQLIVEVEQHFGVRFTSREILKWQRVGEMVDALLEKLS
ncbi:MAG: acyl carrier protein [Bacteroidaceae bacterium]|nr:acyl carrier protein [Bacteroidaceae bacterium]